MTKMNEDISRLNAEIKIIKSNKHESCKEKKQEEKKMKTERVDSEKEEFVHTRNERSSIPSFFSSDFHVRQGDGAKSERKYKRENKYDIMMSQRRDGGHKNKPGGYPFRKLELHQTNSSDTTHESSIPETEIHEAHTDMTTKCFLLDEGALNSYNQGGEEAMFKLSLDLMTDIDPWETSWALFSSHDRNGIIINSMTENSTTSDSLLPHILHRFEYECYVTVEDTNQITALESNKEICYDFDIYDEMWGFCCGGGLGYFTVSINDDTLISERFYGRTLTTPFCLDNDYKLLSKEKEKNPNSIYPPHACHNAGRCICDSKPILTSFEEEDNDETYQVKMNVMVRMMALSGTDKLMDVSTTQYKAACWTLNDDSFSRQQLESTSMSSRRLEQRMIQRYILALFYFATNGQNWFYNFNFLSSLSECEWNSVDAFYNNSFGYIGGSTCDEDERVFSIEFINNNLSGTIIDELFALKSLEDIVLIGDKDVHGTIPSSFGRLSELRRLWIWDNSIRGTIPPELFHAKKMQMLVLAINDLSGTIPESIGNLRDISYLEFGMNSLSQTIPDEIYQLKNLVVLSFGLNELTGTISESIRNLEKLEYFTVNNNKLSGTIPSSMKYMEQLKYLWFNDNNFSGTFPNFLSSSSPNLDVLRTQDNRFTGSVSDAFCEMNMEVGASADCRNDIFKPKVNCSCCYRCLDETPRWDGECADTKISVHIDHETRGGINILERNSDELVWLLVDHSSGENILLKGPISYENDYEPSYEACVAYSQYFFLLMLNEPVQDTNFSISWNGDSIYNGTFFSSNQNKDPFVFEILQNATNIPKKDLVVVDVLPQNDANFNIQLKCGGGSFNLELQTTQRIRYDAAVKISGKKNLRDSSSYQSKALCWILSNELHKETMQSSIHEFIQRYVLTILHLTSKSGLFNTDEYPPLTHECEWLGIKCDNDDTPNIVTGISFSGKYNQIISGTIIQEIGSLAYLETLELRQTEINGTIPNSFSNLWSLTKLDLSENHITGSIPETLFRQLNKLQHIDLSNNNLSGSIPYDMGSYSPLQTVLLNNNKLSGSLPLKDFNYNNLESFDVHENLLNSIDFSLFSKHTKLKILDFSSNFLVATLQEDILQTLTELRIFNISQNELSGVLPSKFPFKSKITHFDVHANRIQGTIHDSITKLSNMQHLNLQGNQLTGSIPSEMNQLEKLNTLVLSHNELKGSIPFDSNKLPNMKTLFLHANELSGRAPQFLKMDKYISDCGVPSESLDQVQCNTCTICCNSENLCHTQIISSVKKPILFTPILLSLLVGFMFMIYTMKERITQNEYFVKFFEERVALWTASKLLGDKTVYHFFLTPSGKGWLIAFSCSIVQMATLVLFVIHADTTSEDTDMEYSMSCSKNSLYCEDTESRSSFGYSIFALILTAWLLKDIVGACKLFLLSLWQRKIDFFFASSVITVVTLFSSLTSIYYNLAIAKKDTDIIANAVILLFVNEIDERLYQLTEACDIEWIKEVNESLERNSYFDRRELLIHRYLHTLRKMIRSTMPMKKSGGALEDMKDASEVSGDESQSKIRSMSMKRRFSATEDEKHTFDVFRDESGIFMDAMSEIDISEN